LLPAISQHICQRYNLLFNLHQYHLEILLINLHFSH
jgi:hypothetical protein